jgi:hypothetical protein
LARQFLIWILSYTKLHLLQRVKVLQSMLNKLMVFKSQFLLIYLLDMVSYVEYVKILLELNRTGTGSSRAINSLFELTFKGRRLQITSGEAGYPAEPPGLRPIYGNMIFGAPDRWPLVTRLIVLILCALSLPGVNVIFWRGSGLSV